MKFSANKIYTTFFLRKNSTNTVIVLYIQLVQIFKIATDHIGTLIKVL